MCRLMLLTITLFSQFNRTPLHYAARNGHSKVVQLLLSHGATVNMKDRVSIYAYKLCMIQNFYVAY